MIGKRISQARKAAGLSMRGLAERAGVSAMSISKYENEQTTPSSRVLIALADVLNVRVEYFFRPTSVKLESVEYRKHSKLQPKKLEQIEANIIEQLERFFELSDYLPVRPVETFNLPRGLPAQIDSYDDIEVVADSVRKAWELGTNPLPELTDMLEERGVMIFQSDILHDKKFDGLAAVVDGFPVVVVGRDWPGDRQRFTLAHELGHLVLHKRLSDHLDEEKACNRFAGAFLAPASEVRKELGETRTWLEPRELCVLKKAWGLSMQGWMYRAADLGILAKSNLGKMYGYFRKRGWHKQEPCENYPREQPQLFLQLVYHALAENLISESKAAELLAMSLTEFHAQRYMESDPQAVNQ